MTTLPDVEPRPRWLNCAETAKLVRAQLKAAFPGQKFSVRSSTYAGGASITVKWADGPTQDQVDAVVDRFAAGRFDGMVDYGWTVKHWLYPDGTVKVAHDPGSDRTGGVHGERFGDPGHPDAQLVRLGADYIHTYREVSQQVIGAAAAVLAGITPRFAPSDERAQCGWCGNWTPRGQGWAARERQGRRFVCSLECAAQVELRFGHVRPKGVVV